MITEFLKYKILKRSTTWRKIREEIFKEFMFLTEVQRNEFADVWEDLTHSEDFKLRKMNKDRSNDPRLYKSLEDHYVEEALKQITTLDIVKVKELFDQKKCVLIDIRDISYREEIVYHIGANVSMILILILPFCWW